MFVDSHCHLTFPELASRLPEIREAMAQAQVDRALCICTTLEEFEADLFAKVDFFFFLDAFCQGLNA